MKLKDRSGLHVGSIVVSMSTIALIGSGKKRSVQSVDSESEYEEDYVQSQEDLEEQEYGDSPGEDCRDGSDSAPTCSECNQPMVFALREQRWICDSCGANLSEDTESATDFESEDDSEDADFIPGDTSHGEVEEFVRFSFISAEGKGRSSVLTRLKTWDLVFTNRRLICARLANTGSAFFWGGLIGYGIAKHRESKKRNELVFKNLDNVLADDKKNFEIPYEAIHSVEFKRGTFTGKLRIIEHNGIVVKFLIKNKEFEPGFYSLGAIFGDRFVSR